MVTIPAPIEVTPSGSFDGIDGAWSSFKLAVGTPAQLVRVLISTLIPESWVVTPSGCGISSLSNCDSIRGYIFNNATSTTWENIGGGAQYSLGVESNLGIPSDDGGYYGYDTLSVSESTGAGVPLTHQVVAGIQNLDFYVGYLGLAQRTSTINNQNQTSFLTSLWEAQKIPSLSYSYSAGRFYDLQDATLVLGGQDSSRFEPNDVNFTMAIDSTSGRDLTVGLQSITMQASDGSSASLLTDGIFSFVDSTLPNIWIPTPDCDLFANAFGLQYQESSLMYTVNSSMHKQNLKNNASLVFQIGNSVEGGNAVNITFPYSAFDLNFTNVESSNPSTVSYFPIRQAADATQYTLGRAFLQEAYLSVNYEFSNFSIFQASPKSSANAHIVSLPSKSNLTSSNPTNPSSPTNTAITVQNQSGSSFPKGAIAGVVIAVIAIVLGIIAFFCLRRRRRAKSHEIHQAAEASNAAVTTAPNMPEMTGEHKDYFAIPTHPGQSAYPSHSKHQLSIEESEAAQELPSPPISYNSHPATYPLHSPPIHDRGGPVELAADFAGAELPSRSSEFGATMPHGPSPSLTPSAAPQRAGASPEPWAVTAAATLSHEPQSPRPSLLSATSLNISAAGPATMVSHMRGRSSPHGGSVSGMSPSALGPEPETELARGGSHRSHASEGTLVNGADGAASPDVGRRQDGGDSAFQSPLLGYAGERENARMRAETGGGGAPYRDVVSPEPLTPP